MATFYNKATLTYNDVSTDSNIVSGEITEVLAATKTALDDEYGAGCPITYVVSLTNTGSSAFTGLTVSDDLGRYANGTSSLTPLTYIANSARLFSNGTLQTAPAPSSTSPLTFTGISVPANGNVLLIYKAAANEYAPLGTGASVTNTVTISGAALPSDVTASAVVNHENAPELSIVKTLSPETVTENSEITYTFVIQNRGGATVTAADNAAVTDTFDPALQNITVTLDGAPLAEGTDYTYNQLTGLFQTTAGRITVPAAEYSQATDGTWSTTPGVTVLKVTGTI